MEAMMQLSRVWIAATCMGVGAACDRPEDPSAVADEFTQPQVTPDPIQHIVETRDPGNVIGAIVDQSGPAPITNADDLLRTLETADSTLTSLQADVMYDRVAGALGDRQVRFGTLAFVTDAKAGEGKPARRRFAVRFNKLRFDDRERAEDQLLIFDGVWFVEKLASEKQLKRRQVVAEGESVDPLKIGEGPFPIPIGQKREEILRRYTAELLPPTEGLLAQENDSKDQQAVEQAALEDFVTNVTTRVPDAKTGKLVDQKSPATFYQLRLTLRPEYHDEEDLREVRLWYRDMTDVDSKGAGRTLLPRLARTVNRAGDVSLVQLKNVRVNTPVDTSMFDASVPVDAGWEVTDVPLESTAPAAAPGK